MLALKKIVDAGTQLFNSLPLVRWNSEKTYLRALSERGIDVIETLWLSKAHLPSLELELGNQGWTKCVIKPVISGSAMHTRCFVIGESSAVAREFAALEPEEWMVQPFAQEITEEGEWSLVFVDNIYCYSVLKRPAPGNFLVQHERGGKYQKVAIDALYVLQAKAALQVCCDIVGDKSALYARLDGVRRNGKFVIMEAELIEPSLFSEIAPEIADVLLDVMLSQC